MKELMMARISRRTVQGIVRFLMELGAILFAAVGVQLVFYFMDGTGLLSGMAQGVIFAIGYSAWKAAQKWRSGTTTLATDSTKDGTAIVVMRTNEDGTRDVLHSWWCPNRESNTAIHRNSQK